MSPAQIKTKHTQIISRFLLAVINVQMSRRGWVRVGIRICMNTVMEYTWGLLKSTFPTAYTTPATIFLTTTDLD